MSNEPNSSKMWPCRHLRAVLIFAAILLMTSVLVAQDKSVMTVRVIDVKTGQPLAHKEIVAERLDPYTHMPLVEPGMPLKAITDSEGKAKFDASILRIAPKPRGDHQQLTKTLDVEVTYTGGGFQCSRGLFSLNEVLDTGVIDDSKCNVKFDRSKLAVNPGEVVLIVGKYHWWEMQF